MNRLAVMVVVVGMGAAGCGRGADPGNDAVVGRGGDTSTTVASPTLEQVKAKVRRGLVAISAYSGELVRLMGGALDAPAAIEERASLVATASGDLRETLPSGFIATYDARRGVERHVAPAGTPPVAVSERRGLAPGPPDTTPGASEQKDVTLLARVLLDLDDATVANASFEDRPAWVVQTETRLPSGVLLGEEIALTVDQASGMVVRAVGTTKGQFGMEVRFEHLVVDPPVDRSQFDPPTPPGATISVEDEGFRRLPLVQVSAVAGYAPLVPSHVPEGYRLAEVAYAEQAAATGSDAHPNPPSRRVVSAAFHRGFQRVVVSTRLRGVHTWFDPHGYAAEADPERIAVESVALVGGALDGSTAQVASHIPEAWNRSQLWAMTSQLVVTVSGDLDRNELIAVAQSLQPRQ